MLVAFQVVCVVSCLVMVAGVLTHRASGGGLSDLLGAGSAASASSSAHASRNLTRITLTAAVVWASSVVVIGLLS